MHAHHEDCRWPQSYKPYIICALLPYLNSGEWLHFGGLCGILKKGHFSCGSSLVKLIFVSRCEWYVYKDVWMAQVVGEPFVNSQSWNKLVRLTTEFPLKIGWFLTENYNLVVYNNSFDENKLWEAELFCTVIICYSVLLHAPASTAKWLNIVFSCTRENFVFK